MTQTAITTSFLASLLSVMAVACTGAPTDDVSPDVQSVRLDVPTPEGELATVDFALSEWSDAGVEGTATIEGVSYTLSVAHTKKGTGIYVASVQDETIFLSSAVAGGNGFVEVDVDRQRWHSGDNSADDLEAIATGNPDVRRMFLLIKGIEMLEQPAAGIQKSWPVLVAALAVYVAACSSEERIQKTFIVCVETPEGEDCTEEQGDCKVRYCDKCVRMCLQNC